MTTREFQKLEYMNSEKFLVGLKQIYADLPMERMPRDFASLRRRDVRHIGEARRCALFCYGVGQLLGVKILFADHESKDYDYVGAYVHNGKLSYVPIQMKEFVPVGINPKAQLQAEINKLRKYQDSSDLVVAMHINRKGFFRLSELDFTGLPIKELWFFGAKEDSAENWLVIGNLLKQNAVWHEFRYPEA
jgi:hypothetical protein